MYPLKCVLAECYAFFFFFSLLHLSLCTCTSFLLQEQRHGLIRSSNFQEKSRDEGDEKEEDEGVK